MRTHAHDKSMQATTQTRTRARMQVRCALAFLSAQNADTRAYTKAHQTRHDLIIVDTLTSGGATCQPVSHRNSRTGDANILQCITYCDVLHCLDCVAYHILLRLLVMPLVQKFYILMHLVDYCDGSHQPINTIPDKCED